MGKADVILKQWLRNKVRFADLFNAVVFNGEQVIKPEELEELNCESGIVISNTSNGWNNTKDNTLVLESGDSVFFDAEKEEQE